jgi:hypothetical protein
MDRVDVISRYENDSLKNRNWLLMHIYSIIETTEVRANDALYTKWNELVLH